MKIPIELGKWYKICYANYYYIKPIRLTIVGKTYTGFVGEYINSKKYYKTRAYAIHRHMSIQLISDEEINNIKVSLL